MSRRELWRWAWPFGIVFAGVGTAAVVLLRGCWHTHMSWPTQYDANYSYRVCTDCGIKRLFDPESFRGYGRYGYDLRELIARDRVRQKKLLGEKNPARGHLIIAERQGGARADPDLDSWRSQGHHDNAVTSMGRESW